MKFITLAFCLIVISSNISLDNTLYEKVKNYDFKNPLLTAIKNNNIRNVKKYIKNGIDLNEAENINLPIKVQGSNKYLNVPFVIYPLILSIIYKNNNITKLLLQNDAKITEDYLLLGLSDAGITKLLINYGADLNLRDDDGRSCIHYSIIYGNKYNFQILLNSGVNINLKDFNGWTTLGLAKAYKKYDIIKFIMNNQKYKNPDIIPESKIFNKIIEINLLNLTNYDKNNPDIFIRGLRADLYRLNGEVIGYRFITVRPHSPFYSFGLRNGDILKKINGKTIRNTDLLFELPKILSTHSKIYIEYIRDNKIIKLQIILLK